ncbi:MAG: branched-chain amino acid ABC transporter permease [Pseudomonadota bacterium]|jgi:branched-chain amino acid transport system permease protein|uniref:Amino acid/amide ABC transporter membrane protein 2, HAAT family (TC 3.A.1.4.-) n=1 Tax=Thalassococcus halodurans TaxID=373675 RepID=A0A1H5U7V1_9RHOB|nr:MULTISPECIES: branched-chain amino acid ABC transporter permease [Thalassococcus]MBO6866377.1 branched-chain amino acid ABC transporter permease [Thalassococcus sp.]MEC8582486.1 branched-chain amino acid ABC transporter permease [Pseudomonadota bacterium]MEE3361306.1 branched-chain amino acid ABC transporter permease [Pseudomonadota bacterium]SEF71103.1 amino acid/amide ABC transporter membrane protein 2, HAAT family (TC 3.A.1.4.-) [Thalassococcus halodurans]
MFYRTAGQFKTSYKADQALFPVRQDAILLMVILAFAWVVFPLTASEFTFQTLLIPVLIYALAAMGLNILTGFAGQLSLGTAAFMGVGAYACYKLITIFPWMNPIVAIMLSGIFSAGIGVAFGIPSLRIKGFYLAIATLAAQFFLVWLFEKWAWLYNYNASGAIQVPNIEMAGVWISGPQASSITQYYVVLAVVTIMTILCINLTRGTLGRTWKATRDMDIAAELIGINLMKSKLTAFAISSYIVGVSGALFVFMWRGAAEPNLFDIQLSFRVLFIAIIGGLGSIMGNYLGAILIVGLPVVLNIVPSALGIPISSATVEHLNIMIVGALIIFFLIIEPHGLNQLWRLIREKLTIWPFPH